MRKVFVPLAVLTAAMFAYAPIAIARAPYESTMLLVQKIFYFHFATWMAVTAALVVCGVASAVYLFKGSPTADRIGRRLRGTGRRLHAVRPGQRIAVGAQSVGHLVGLGTAADDGVHARADLLRLHPRAPVRWARRREAGGGDGHLRRARPDPFIYKSVDWWRTIHPKTSVMRTLADTAGGAIMWNVVMFCTADVSAAVRARAGGRGCASSRLRADLDRLYLAAED